jgi:hypothetical protein
VATFPAFLNALRGSGCAYCATVNTSPFVTLNGWGRFWVSSRYVIVSISTAQTRPNVGKVQKKTLFTEQTMSLASTTFEITCEWPRWRFRETPLCYDWWGWLVLIRRCPDAINYQRPMAKNRETRNCITLETTYHIVEIQKKLVNGYWLKPRSSSPQEIPKKVD